MDSRVRGCEGTAVDIDGDDALVNGSSISRIDDGCIDVDGDDAVVENNGIRGCDSDDGVHIQGVRALIQGNSIRNVDGTLVEVQGERASVIGNRGGSAYDYCYELPDDRAKVIRNKGTNCEQGGIVSSGTDSAIRGNEIGLIYGDGIYADGSGTVIARNLVSETLDENEGIYAGADNVRLVGNRVEKADGRGIELRCSTACANAEVSDNVVTDVFGYDAGIEIQITGTGSALIEDNRVVRAADIGIQLDLDEGLVRGNTVRASGTGDADGFDLRGDNNLLAANRAIANNGDGFEINGTANLVSENVARSNQGDGFQIEAAALDVALSRNVAIGNAADGIENDGTDTTLRRNEASGNRRDCANDGTIAVTAQNECADGSDFALVGTASRAK